MARRAASKTSPPPKGAREKGELASRVRAALAQRNDVTEVKMFGGTGFLLRGNLMVGASVRGMLLRVGAPEAVKALARPGARPLIMRGTALKDYIYVDPPPADDRTVRAWLKLAVAFVETLPAKQRKARSQPRATRKG